MELVIQGQDGHNSLLIQTTGIHLPWSLPVRPMGLQLGLLSTESQHVSSLHMGEVYPAPASNLVSQCHGAPKMLSTPKINRMLAQLVGAGHILPVQPGWVCTEREGTYCLHKAKGWPKLKVRIE